MIIGFEVLGPVLVDWVNTLPLAKYHVIPSVCDGLPQSSNVTNTTFPFPPGIPIGNNITVNLDRYCPLSLVPKFYVQMN
jgi:hypothetical protein